MFISVLVEDMTYDEILYFLIDESYLDAWLPFARISHYILFFEEARWKGIRFVRIEKGV